MSMIATSANPLTLSMVGANIEHTVCAMISNFEEPVKLNKRR